MNISKNPAICCLFAILLLLSLTGPVSASFSVDHYDQIAAGYNHTAGIEQDWTLWTWGSNAYGQLGDGTTVDRYSPVQVGSDGDGIYWVFLAAGSYHTLGIKANGTLWAWGYNNHGQLGNGDPTLSDQNAPVQIGSDTDWASVIAGSYHTIGIKANGTLWAWGYNNHGQLGNGDPTLSDQNAPVQIGSDTDWASVAAGDLHTLGIKTGGTLWAWGYNNHGQLGDGTTGDATTHNRLTPVPIGSDTWVSVATDAQTLGTGNAHTLGIKTGGTLWAWGSDDKGQLGDGTTGDINHNRTAPVQIGSDTDWASIAAGYRFTLGIKTGGTLWAWGYNFYGQFGNGTSGLTPTLAPVQIGSDTDWASVVAGYGHSAAIKTDTAVSWPKTVWAWGANWSGQVGDGDTTDVSTPQILEQDHPVPDTTGPSAGPLVVSNIAYGGFVGSSFDLSAGFTDNESTITSCEYCVSTDGTCDTEWAAATVSGAGPTWTCTRTGITGSNGQVLTLNMRATSGGGTTPGASITRTVDAITPAYTWNVPAAYTYFKNGNTINVDASITETGSGITNGADCNPNIDYALDSFTGTVNYSSSTGRCAGTLTLKTPSGLSDGPHYLTLQVADHIGNSAGSAADTVNIDNTPPASGASFNVTPGDSQCSLSWDLATDSGTGLDATQPYEVRAQAGSDPGSCSGGTQAYVGTGLGATQINLSNGTTYYYRLCYQDKLGNKSEFSGNPKTCALSAAATTTVGDGSSPADKTVAPSATNKAVSAFTLQTNTGSDAVTSITVTGTNMANVATIKIYQDNGTVSNEWDSGDTLMGSLPATSSPATISVSGVTATTAATQYLIVYDFKAVVNDGQQLTAYVSSIGSTNSKVYNDNADATITISGAPVTTITGKPAASVNTNMATFSFSASKTGCTFQCQIDTKAYTACTSPVVYPGLANGSHTFSVKATDPLGTTGLPASYTWTVTVPSTTTIPNTTITAKPSAISKTNTAAFSFTSTVTGSTFYCQMDSGAYQICTSPSTYPGLGEGSHTFSVTASSRNNADTSPATFTWTVDTVLPDTLITGHPDAVTKIDVSTFTFSATESSVTFQCSLDGSVYAICTSPKTYTAIGGGVHTFAVKAADSAGNADPTPAQYTWTIDPTDIALTDGQLLVNGSPFTVKGVVYSPVPIGEDISSAPFGDYFTSAYSGIYNRDLPLLRDMGANSILLYLDGTDGHTDFLNKAYNSGLNPVYILAGFDIEGGQDLSDQTIRDTIKNGFSDMVTSHMDHPAVLMWVIGQNLNTEYGNNPDLYSLIEEMAAEAHSLEGDNYHPVVAGLFDSSDVLAAIQTHEASVPSVDIWGLESYQGNTFGTLFADYKAVSAKPLIILGYGIDAYDNNTKTENASTQSIYASSLWGEIAGCADCAGGVLKEYSDEWWTGRLNTDVTCSDLLPAVHGLCGSVNTSFPDGYDNEEWWGIMRPVKSTSGPDTMQKRTIYTTLQTLWTTLTVTSPNGGETLYQGDIKTISWKYSGNPGSSVKIELLKAGVLKQSIVASVSRGTNGVGTYAWTVPATLTVGSDYSIRITSTTMSGVQDVSDAFFSVQIPMIAVTSPNGGETWYQGQKKTITWNYYGNIGTAVKIDLYQGTTLKTTIIASTSKGTNGTGTYNWTIPATLSGTTFKIKVTSTTKTTINDLSDNTFTVSPPGIQVTSPNGGESWTRGTAQQVQWTYTGSPCALVKVDLYKGAALNRNIIASTSIGAGGAGSYSWPVVPLTQTPGTDYKVKVTCTTNSSYNDMSDNNFSIQ